MKRTLFKRSLSLLLVILVLLLPMVSPAFAAEEIEKSTPPADIPTALGAGNGLALWAGEKLAGGLVSSIAGYPANKAMGKIFGTDTDQILQFLESIRGDIQNLKNDIRNLSNKINKVQLQGLLNDYGDFIDKHVAVYNELIRAQNINDPAVSTLLFTKIFKGEDPNYMVGGDSLKNATINLGIRIRSTRETEGGPCNVFGAIDLYDRYVNVWEHQGYAMRESFREKQLAIYTLYSAMSQLACQTIIDNNQGATPEAILARLEAEGRMKDLKDDAELMDKMVKRTSIVNLDKTISVVRHPNLRIARDLKQGKDLCAFLPDINVAWVTKNAWGDEPAWAEFSRSADRYTSASYIYSLTHDSAPRRTAWAQGWEIHTNQPTPDEYRILLDNYDNKHTLYEIFFDNNLGGNFNNIGNRPAELSFLCNHYVSRNRTDRHGNRFITWESHNHMGNNGDVYGWWEFSSAWHNRDDSMSPGRFDHSNAFIVNKYLGEVTQGTLMTPSPFPPDIDYEDLITGMESLYELPHNGGAIILELGGKTGDAYQ